MYFIAIVLPEDLNQKVLNCKQYMAERYNCRVALKSPAHITIIPPFWMNPSFEINLFEDVDVISNCLEPFDISTNNFSSFKPKTIFVATLPNLLLNDTKQKTDDYFSGKPLYKIKIDSRPFHPHITIATRDLQKKDYYEAWEHFKDKSFNYTWTAKNMQVLKHNTIKWEVVHLSPFKKT